MGLFDDVLGPENIENQETPQTPGLFDDVLGPEGAAPESIPKEEFDDRNIVQKGADLTTRDDWKGRTLRFLSPALSIYGFTRTNDFFTPEKVPALNRAGASIKTNLEGRRGYLEETVGKTRPDPITGEMQVEVGGEYVPVNEPRKSVSDVAGLAGPALSFGPSAALGVASLFPGTAPIAASPLAQGAASGLGTGLRHGASALLPGGGETLTESAMQTGQDALMGWGLTKGVNLAAKGFDYIRPSNIAKRAYDAATGTDWAKEGKRLSSKTGVNLTPGRETGSDSLLIAENKAKQTIGGRKPAASWYTSTINKTVNYLNKTHKLLDPKRLTREKFGEQALALTKKAANSAFDIRSAAAAADDTGYGIFNKMTDGGPSIPAAHYSSALEDIFNNYSGTRTAAKQGKSILGDLGDSASIKKILDNRNKLAKAASGKGRLFDGLDPGTDRQIARTLQKAIEKDMEVAELMTGFPYASQLKVANSNYRINSAKIQEIEESVVGKLFDKTIGATPEDAAKALLKLTTKGTADTTKLKNIVRILDNVDPTFSNSYRGQIAGDLMDSASAIVPTSKYPNFSPEDYLASAHKLDKESIMTLFSKPKQRQAFYDGISLNLRLRGANPDFSGMISPEQMMKEASMVGMGAATGNQVGPFAAGFASKWFTPRFISKQIFDETGQHALRTLVTTKPNTIAYTNAVGILMSRAKMEQMREEDVETAYRKEQNPGMSQEGLW